uniref:Leucine-rich PPR motif-containing protein, mitochondrial-like n=1 Tax=Sinocyclocheilus anshuiensis TaxID=1608454 RepID=A0A671LHA9_9TELE
MAALLRSARLLKCSPALLLQVTGNTRHAPAAGLPMMWTDLYTLLFCSLSSYTSALPCVSCRQYGVVPEQRGLVKDEPSVAVRSKQAQQFDWALAKLDSSVRRTGRVTKTLLLHIFHDICRTGYPSGNQALLMLRSCGSLLPEVPLVERIELSQRIWDKLQELGATYDVSHYNALLKTYLQNEFRFSPTDFLAKMEAANVQPNRVTYQRLIAAYCEVGDIEGASTILGFMKSKDLPITEAVFNSLATGHARARDMDSAEGILSVMKGAGIEPGPDTYLSLLNVYAEKGDFAKMKQTLEMVENADIHLMDRDLMQVVFSLTKAGHQQYVLTHPFVFISSDAMNLCLSLITHGHEETAFSVLKSFTGLLVQSQTSDSPDLGNFFLRHCVNMDKVNIFTNLKDSGLHSSPLQFTLQCSLEAKKTGMAVELMRRMKEEGVPLRPHYFWPLFTHYQKEKNISGNCSGYVCFLVILCDRIDVDANILIAAELRAEASRGNLAGLFSLSKHFVKLVLLSFFAENVAYFLYNLIDSMNETEVHSKEEQLREYFGLLKNMNISISLNIFRGIRNILESYQVPELVKVFYYYHHSKPVVSICVSMCVVELCLSHQKLERALELKILYEADMTPAAYAMLINLCCRHDNAEEALKLKMELARKDSEVALDAQKYVALVRVLSKHGKLEEAIDMLKEMKEKDVQLRDGTISLLTLTMNTAAMKGDANSIRRLQEAIFTLGLAKPSSNLCSPLITCYLESGNYAGAFDATVEVHKQYNQMPKIHDLICGLVEKGDAELLQNVVEFLSQERGEMMMLYDLYFAFLQTGRYKEARKIIETPGLRARPTRLQWFAEKCIAAQQMEPLENMVDMTVKLFECDRDDMYHCLLRLCKETNDWQKAEATWMKMQEENLAPRERTLRLLADILKNNDKEVPFEVPEAYDMLKEAGSTGMVLGPAPYDTLIKALLAKGNIEDAMAGMLQADQVPSQLAITRLVQGLASEGNTQDIQEVEALVKTLGSIKLSSMLFVNNAALAHIKNEDIDSAVELLQSFYIQNTDNQKSSISFVFRKVLDANNDAALDKLSAMVERLCNHFASYRAATDLFLMYLDTGRTEEAKFLLQVLSLTNQDICCILLPVQAAKIKALSELIPDFTEKENIYSHLVKCCGLDKDFSSAKALYERMQAEGVKADELTLKRLALLYKEAGEPVPFEEPPESFSFYADKLKKQRSESMEPADC